MENRYTDSVKNAWKFAAEEASKLGSEYVGTEHLLIGISNEKDSVGGKILNSLGLTVTALEEFLQAYNDSVFFRNTDLYIAPRTKRVLEMAVEEANELGNNYVGTEHLLLAIIHEGGGLAIRILEQFNVTGGKLKRAFEQFMSEENDSEKNENLGDLGEFAIDLNERAKQGKIDPVVGRQTEINRVIQILSRRNKNNPVLIGEPGVGKTAIAEGLAQRIINNDVPEILKNCRIISLNMSSVVAGTKYRGEFEERLKKVLEEVKKHENWILFIDELHTLVGAGAGEGSMDAANIMKPALARGEIRCIGATTLKEYKKYIEKDAALERRFQPVKVGEPTPKDTIDILMGLRDRYEALEEDVAEVVAKWTGVPLQNLKQKDSERLLHLEEELHKRVIGQEDAVTAVAKAIRRARAGMKDPKRPIGSFLFLGSTGVGKTELARALAETMFGSEKNMLRFDMSEYMEKHEVSRLVGAPPGYVGYEEGGQLTDAVRRNPYSVILFDEVEKAHADFFNILLQVLDDGRLTDGQGRTVDFTNCVIIMTSNLGSGLLRGKEKKLGFIDKNEDKKDFESAKAMIIDQVKHTFRPEFINRIDEIIVFHPLTTENLSEIAKLLLKAVEKKLEHLHLKMDVSEKARNHLIADGSDFEYGARPLKRTIQKEVEDEISELLLSGKLKGKSTIHVDVGEKNNLVFNAD